MNLMHLKYAVEVEKCRSISVAANNLFMGQPNLSRAIKELEESLGITIFKRTSRGMLVTPQGEEFLGYAKSILGQIEEVEAIYKKNGDEKQKFSISVPRASYISYAFAQFANSIDKSRTAEMLYKETNSLRAINNILNANYKLGIIRYASNYDKYFREMLEEKGLIQETVATFSYVLVMSEKHPLADKENIQFADLSGYTEIAHSDSFVPSMPFTQVQKSELTNTTDKRIFVFERASQFDLLSMDSGTFMWVSPLPQNILEKYGLVQKTCAENTKTYKDVLIHRKEYRLTDLDNKFITEVTKAKRLYL